MVMILILIMIVVMIILTEINHNIGVTETSLHGVIMKQRSIMKQKTRQVEELVF
jgi:hypothetical protein